VLASLRRSNTRPGRARRSAARSAVARASGRSVQFTCVTVREPDTPGTWQTFHASGHLGSMRASFSPRASRARDRRDPRPGRHRRPAPDPSGANFDVAIVTTPPGVAGWSGRPCGPPPVQPSRRGRAARADRDAGRRGPPAVRGAAPGRVRAPAGGRAGGRSRGGRRRPGSPRRLRGPGARRLARARARRAPPASRRPRREHRSATYDAAAYRERLLAEVDEAARTGRCHRRCCAWEARLEDVAMWRFQPTVVHGDLTADQCSLTAARSPAAQLGDAKVADPPTTSPGCSSPRRPTRSSRS